MSTAQQTPEELIGDCQNLVLFLARKVHRRSPVSVELDDLIAYGNLGLAEAAREFDPTKPVKFSTYAYYRIRGSIYDGLYKMCGSQRRRARDLRTDKMGNALLQSEAESSPTATNDLNQEAGWFQRITGSLAVAYLATRHDEEGDAPAVDPADTASRNPLTLAAKRELIQRLNTLVDRLPAESASLIRATYFEGLTLQEAGERLGISKSWASRLHARALDQLARGLRELGVES